MVSFRNSLKAFSFEQESTVYVLTLSLFQIDSDYGIQVLLDHPQQKKWSVFVAVDIGYGREGVRWDSQLLVDLVNKILQVVSTR